MRSVTCLADVRVGPLLVLAVPAFASAPPVDVIDLTHPLEPDIPVYPGGVPPSVEHKADLERDGYFANALTIGEHAGTHVDAPAHMIAGAATVDQIPASWLVGPGVVLDVREQCASNPDYLLTYLDVREWESRHGRIPNGAIMMVLTGWGERWNDPAAYLNKDDAGVMHFPGLSPEVAEYLVTYRDVSGIGIDTLSIDFGPSRSFRAHRTLHADGIYHVENVANLDRLPPTGATIVVSPLPIAGGSGAPARVTALVPAEREAPAAPGGDKVLVEFGWDIPTAKTLVDAAAAGTAFDGAVFDPEITLDDGTTKRFSWAAFGGRVVSREQAVRIIADLEATPLEFRRHSLLRFNVTPGDVDWFGDWTAIRANALLAGLIVHEARLAGILFDVEQYEGRIFDSRTRPPANTHAEYEAMAEARGRLLMETINEQADSLDVLLTFGPSLSDRVRESAAYGLLPAFIDGMLDAATDGTTIIDGYEYSYPFRTREAFERGREEVLRDSGGRCAVGFGIWLDWNSGRYGWKQEPSENWFTPESFRDAVRHALDLSDKYVWVYSERLNWWTREDLPEAYVNALAETRR